ncbi:MAG: glycosyltransferase [Candidatus Hodarchaeota archaeon]
MYEGIDELRKKIEHFLWDEESRKRIARKGSEIVNKEHTLSRRCDELFAWMEYY